MVRGEIMSENAVDARALLSRLERIERQNYRLRQIGLLLLVLWGAVFWMAQKRPVRIQDAQKFLLKDTSGRNRAELGIFPGGPALVFYDLSGNPTLSVGIQEDGPGVVLMAANEQRVANLSSTPTGPILTLYDHAGAKRLNLSVTAQGPALGLLGEKGAARGALGMTADESVFLQLFGRNEHGGAQLYAAADRSMLRFLDAGDKTRAAFGLLEKEGTPGLTLNDAAARARLLLMLPPQGPALTVLDEDKKVTWQAP
jgi:hypothetical protein